MGSRQDWLDDREQQAWRVYLRAHAELLATLHRRLMEQTGLSITDYEVLVNLSEAPDERLRIGALADALQWERSRVSHQVSRMVRRGLVERDDCDTDGRGAYAVLTPLGRTVLAAAAPMHAADVRSLFVEPVGSSLDGLTAASRSILDAQ